MLLKSLDSKTDHIILLEDRLRKASTGMRSKLKNDLHTFKAGIRGEEEAAYFINFDFEASRRMLVLHDLHLEHQGRRVQIDHLLIHRTFHVFVLESKHCNSRITITEEGEFLRWNQYKHRYDGMPSPLAQNERHIQVLKEIIDTLPIQTRIGIKPSPTFHSLVLVSPRARIGRPSSFDSHQVIKADQVLENVERELDRMTVLGGLANLMSQEALKKLGESLLGLHRPLPLDNNAVPQHHPDSKGTSSDPKLAPRSFSPAEAAPRCRFCNQTQLTIRSGPYSYYFKCLSCQKNTPIYLLCAHDGHRERIQKAGQQFFRVCEQCGGKHLFFENP